MRHTGTMTLRGASFVRKTSGLRVKRRSLFTRMIIALQLSRSRQTRHIVHHYRHLIAEDFRGQMASAILDFNNERKGSQNANGDQAAVHTNHRTDPSA
jgi:hypothetical protein